MLMGIERRSREDALVLLRWLAYARSPLSLSELAEARVIDPAEDGSVDVDDRGDLEDSLDILAGLITIEGVDDSHGAAKDSGSNDSVSEEGSQNTAHSIRQVEKDTRVRLAHFSVKDYLESKHILHSNAKMFYLKSVKEHRFLARSCLTYLLHYSDSVEKASDKRDLAAFPLLEYAAHNWFIHSSLQQPGDVSREVSLLASESAMYDWLLVYQPDWPSQLPFTRDRDVGTGLYYACFLGLGDVSDRLLLAGVDINAPGGQHAHALQAAIYAGHHNIAKTLIAEGANVNAIGGECGSALGAAVSRGYKELAKMLIAEGADVNTGCEMLDGSPLYAALSRRDEDVAEMLIYNGADVDSQKSVWHLNPILLAIDRNCLKILDIWIARGVGHETMQALSCRGDSRVMQMLINAGADVNAQGGLFGNVLQAASFEGCEEMMKVLINAGADVNAQGGAWGNALQAASYDGQEHLVSMLLDRGADVNAEGGRFGSALQAAATGGHEKAVEILIKRGAHVNAQGGRYGNALRAASLGGHEEVVTMLIEHGAALNAQGDRFDNALQAVPWRL
jgi:ankyrin repeat protein/catabolite regulation protein CreA